jgi:hypothetical protein
MGSSCVSSICYAGGYLDERFSVAAAEADATRRVEAFPTEYSRICHLRSYHRNRTGAAQDHDADGCAALSNGTRRAKGTHRLCHRLQPGPDGHVPISQTPTPRRRADQLSRCAAMARRAEQRDPVRRVDPSSPSDRIEWSRASRNGGPRASRLWSNPGKHCVGSWSSKSPEVNFMPFRFTPT